MSWMQTIHECDQHNNCTVHSTVPQHERGYANGVPVSVEHVPHAPSDSNTEG